ncbi:MAG TPA: DnaJ domain-containing protein [Candidatus Limnocylindrales bacterium]
MDIALQPTRVDYYQMLGLDPSAPMEAVQGAYRILARRLHPDVSGDPSTAEAMSRANTIYQALVAKPVPADFSMDQTPVYRRAQSGTDPLSIYRQAMTQFGASTGRQVDVRA